MQDRSRAWSISYASSKSLGQYRMLPASMQSAVQPPIIILCDHTKASKEPLLQGFAACVLCTCSGRVALLWGWRHAHGAQLCRDRLVRQQTGLCGDTSIGTHGVAHIDGALIP